MDQVRSLSLESLNYQSFKAQYLMKLTQFLVSVSLCSFLFSPSSLLAFLHYFNFYFSTFPLQLFTHTIDKNCMFLLCNGLLVFVGITRSFSGSSGSDDAHEEEAGSLSSSSFKNVDDGSRSEFSDIEDTEPSLVIEAEERSREPDEQNIPADEAVETKYSDEGEEDIEKAIVEDEVEQEEEELRTSHLILEDEETGMLDAGDEEVAERDDDLLMEENLDQEEIEYDEEEEEEEDGRLSTDELNKKFDDFIRRMREDLRFEARQQLIMV